MNNRKQSNTSNTMKMAGTQNSVLIIKGNNGIKCVKKIARSSAMPSIMRAKDIHGYMDIKKRVCQILNGVMGLQGIPNYVINNAKVASVAPFVCGEPMATWAARTRFLEDVACVEAQLMHVLESLSINGIFHNDVHAYNIIVVKGHLERKTLTFKESSATCMTRYKPVLIDWDHASMHRSSCARALGIFHAAGLIDDDEFCAAPSHGDMLDYVANTILPERPPKFRYPSFATQLIHLLLLRRPQLKPVTTDLPVNGLLSRPTLPRSLQAMLTWRDGRSRAFVSPEIRPS